MEDLIDLVLLQDSTRLHVLRITIYSLRKAKLSTLFVGPISFVDFYFSKGLLFLLNIGAFCSEGARSISKSIISFEVFEFAGVAKNDRCWRGFAGFSDDHFRHYNWEHRWCYLKFHLRHQSFKIPIQAISIIWSQIVRLVFVVWEFMLRCYVTCTLW